MFLEMVKVLFSPAPDARKKVAELTSAVFRLYKQGQYGQARPISEEAVRLSYEWFGEEDPDTASCLNNLGLLQKAMGKLAEARPFYERALSIRQNILGVDHPHTVDSLINLGLLLSEMGDPEARHYFEMVLASRRKVLGPNHPVTADCLTDLGNELMVLGDLKEARSCLEQALAIHRNTRGSKHPKTAASLLNLGTLLHTMGDLPGARRHYEQALPICREVLGPDHPHSSICLHSLGLLTAPDGPVAKLPFDNLQPFLDLLLVGAGAIPTEQELTDIRGHGILPGELPHQVLADDVPVEGIGTKLIQVIEFHYPPTVTACLSTTVPALSTRTRFVARPTWRSSSTTTAADPSSVTGLASKIEDLGSLSLSRRSTRQPV